MSSKTAEPTKALDKIIGSKAFIFTPQNLAEAKDYAVTVANSGLVPAAYKGKPDDILVAWQYGAELGVQPLQALQGIAVINGRPTVWGDLALAIVQGSSAYEWHEESDDGQTATFKAKRKGNPHIIVSTFSTDDAKAAGLDKKQGPWSQYPKRMRKMRARAFGLRDGFADVLKGMSIREEVEDYVEVDKLGDGVSLVRPRRASETAAAPAAATPEPTPPAPTPADIAEQVIKVVIEKTTAKSQKNTDGDDETVFFVYAEKEKYWTLEETLAAEAKKLANKEAELGFVDTEQGKKLVSLKGAA